MINITQCLESRQSRIATSFKGGIGGFEGCSFLSLGLEACLYCRSGDMAIRTTAHASQLPIEMYYAGSLATT